jgi:hypothetical protein
VGGVLLFCPRARRVWGLDLSTVGLAAMVGLVSLATGSLYAYLVAALLATAAIDSALLMRRVDRLVVIRRLFRRTRRMRVGSCSFGWRRERFGRAALATHVFIREGTTIVNVESYSLLNPRRVERVPDRLAGTLLRDPTA